MPQFLAVLTGDQVVMFVYSARVILVLFWGQSHWPRHVRQNPIRSNVSKNHGNKFTSNVFQFYILYYAIRNKETSSQSYFGRSIPICLNHQSLWLRHLRFWITMKQKISQFVMIPSMWFNSPDRSTISNSPITISDHSELFSQHSMGNSCPFYRSIHLCTAIDLANAEICHLIVWCCERSTFYFRNYFSSRSNE